MGKISWYDGDKKVPPGTTETEIRDGQARDSVMWPRKGTLYTKPGELHVPVVVKTKDSKRHVGDCVIKYRVVNSAALLPYLNEEGELDANELARDLSYEARASIVPKLSEYTSEELEKHADENRALVQYELSGTLADYGLTIKKIYTVWEDKELPPIHAEPPKQAPKPEEPKPKKKKPHKVTVPAVREVIVEKVVERTVPPKSLSESEVRSLAKKQAEDYLNGNPRYGSAGEAAFWLNSLEQVFYQALKEGGYGTD